MRMPINWFRRKYTEDEFRKAWTSSDSIAGVARALGCNTTGGGYHTLRSTAEELGLTRHHMSGQSWNQGERYRPIKIARSLEDILVKDSPYKSSSDLKKRLFKEGVKVPNCEMCGLTEWMGQPAPLALDHINGVHSDNRLENLRILCYNCHGLTETFAGKNIGKVGPCIPTAEEAASKAVNV